MYRYFQEKKIWLEGLVPAVFTPMKENGWVRNVTNKQWMHRSVRIIKGNNDNNVTENKKNQTNKSFDTHYLVNIMLQNQYIRVHSKIKKVKEQRFYCCPSQILIRLFFLKSQWRLKYSQKELQVLIVFSLLYRKSCKKLFLYTAKGSQHDAWRRINQKDISRFPNFPKALFGDSKEQSKVPTYRD